MRCLFLIMKATLPRPGRGTRWLMAVFLTLSLAGLPPADAKTLKDKKTKLKVKAPAGFRLKSKNGIYTVTNGNAYVKFIRGRSPLSTKGTAQAYMKDAKIKKAKLKKKGKRYFVTGKLKGKEVTVEFRPKGKLLDVITYGVKRGRLALRSRNVSSRAIQPAAPLRLVTVGQILGQLQRIANSRRGGTVLPLPVTVPLRRFTQGGATALVPDLPGWQYSGAGGAISGGNVNQGAFGFGLFWPFGGPLLTPDQAIIQAWPALAPGLTVTGLAQIPGTEGWLGFNYLSAMYAVRFNLAGRSWQGLILSGTTDPGIGFSWYQSYVAVPDNGPGGIAQALLNSWASWDPSQNANARLNQALRTVLTTVIPGNPIDPEVFDRAQQAWVEYIRGN